MTDAKSNAETRKVHVLPQGTLEPRYSALPDGFLTRLGPELAPTEPIIIHLNGPLLDEIGFDADNPAPELIDVLAGQAGIEGAEPFASVYAGHQFGQFVPQLGDGRAVTIAEGRSNGRPWELQLKGSGRTPYSRFGDGRAVLRSCLREYLASEHLHALGIPTTRATSVIATREGVQRETVEPGAVMSRVAPSHIRFGHFEYFHHRDEQEKVKRLADHLLEFHFEHLSGSSSPYAAMFREIAERTARLVAKWQSVAFVHGVMNTDNMSVLGLTIDYGPFGFLDDYDPGRITNHSDHTGRYVLSNQPTIAQWNLRALAVALTSIVSMDDLNEGLDAYATTFEQSWSKEIFRKLGLQTSRDGDSELANDFLEHLRRTSADFTQSWHKLSDWVAEDQAEIGDAPLNAWRTRWRARLADEDGDARTRLRQANPKFVLRNWVAETAIRAVEDDFDLKTLDRIFRIMTDPYADHGSGDQVYAGPPPEEMKDLEVSCSA